MQWRTSIHFIFRDPDSPWQYESWRLLRWFKQWYSSFHSFYSYNLISAPVVDVINCDFAYSKTFRRVNLDFSRFNAAQYTNGQPCLSFVGSSSVNIFGLNFTAPTNIGSFFFSFKGSFGIHIHDFFLSGQGFQFVIGQDVLLENNVINFGALTFGVSLFTAWLVF